MLCAAICHWSQTTYELISINATASCVANSRLQARFLPFKTHKSSQHGAHGQKEGGTRQVEILARCESKPNFVCVIFLSGPRLCRSKTLACWHNDGWSMVKWLVSVKALKASFKAQTNEQFTLHPLLIHRPNWKMRHLVSKHKTKDTVHRQTNFPPRSFTIYVCSVEISYSFTA